MFNRLDLQEVQERRGQLLDEMEAYQNLAKAENRDITTDEAQHVDKLMSQHDALDADELRAKAFMEAKRKAAEIRAEDPPAKPPAKPLAAVAAAKKVFATAVDRSQLRVFQDPEDAYHSGMWLKAVCLRDKQAHQHCVDHGLNMRFRTEDGDIRMDALTTDDDTKGGYLVPSPLQAAILFALDRYGVTRRLARTVPMTSETLSIPKRTGGLTVYSPSEGSAITKSEPTVGNVSLSVTDRFTLTSISRTLLRSSVVSVVDWLALEIGQAFGEEMDLEFITGDGTGTYFGETGVRSAIGSAGTNSLTTTSEDTWAEIDLANFTDTAALLPEKYHGPDTRWLCSRAFYSSVIERLMIAAGGTTTANIAAGGQPSLLGYPIEFSEKMPTATAVSTIHVLLGDFQRGVLLGTRQEIEIATSEHVYFATDEIGIRGKMSYDINVYEPGDSSDAGAYVAMETGAAS